MNTKLLLIILIASVSSCTTAYKTGQTPDDVYFSPAIPQNDYVSVNNDEKDGYYSSSDDETRRRINNRVMREYDYDLDYGLNYPYSYNFPLTYPYSYYSYPYSYSYYPPIYVNPITGKSPLIYTAPRKYNLSVYGNNTLKTNTTNNVIYRPELLRPAQATTPTTNAAIKKSSGFGNFVRRVLTNSSNTNSYSNDYNNYNSGDNRNYQPARNTSVSAPSSSSSSSSSSGSNVPVRTFHR